EEVEFVETPRKTPLPTPDMVDPEPAFPFHGEAPDVPLVQPSAAAEVDEHHDELPPDPLTRMTLIDVEEQGDGPTPPPDPEAVDPLDKVMEDFERKPGPRGKRGKGGKGPPYARSPLVTMQEEMPRAEPVMEDAPPSVAEPTAEPAM